MQIAAERRYQRRPTRAQIERAFAEGATIYMPQVHQVLPRVARLMTALRATLFGPGREECSFLFLVNGKGRQGMGLHHDGDVDSVWLQLEGRRTVTTGPPVSPGTRADLHDLAVGRGWHTRDLAPGSLFYLPPRTPHRVVCHGRSLALSLTWKRRRTPLTGHRGAKAMTAWDVVAGRAEPIPRASRRRVWTQVPVFAGAVDRKRGDFPLWLDGGVLRLPERLMRSPSGWPPCRLWSARRWVAAPGPSSTRESWDRAICPSGSCRAGPGPSTDGASRELRPPRLGRAPPAGSRHPLDLPSIVR